MNPQEETSILRTLMANERTVLAYIRTSLAFLAAGAWLVHSSSGAIPVAGGWFFIAAAAFVFGKGVGNYLFYRNKILSTYKVKDAPGPGH